MYFASVSLPQLTLVSDIPCKTISHRAREGISRDCTLITELKRKQPPNTPSRTPRLSELYRKRKVIDLPYIPTTVSIMTEEGAGN